MTRHPARALLALGTGASLLFGLSACAFETVFTADGEDDSADRATALSVPGSADLIRSSSTGPDALNDDAEPGSPMEFVDPVLLDEDGELPRHMTVTEAQSLQVLQKVADMITDQGNRVDEIATVRAYLSPDPDADGDNDADGVSGADFEGWDRAYRTFFANVDPLTGDSLLTGTSAVTVTAETAPNTTSESEEPDSDDDDDATSSSAASSAPSTPTDTTGGAALGEPSDDDAPYSGDRNATKPTVLTVGVAEQPVNGWLVQVEIEAYFDNE